MKKAVKKFAKKTARAASGKNSLTNKVAVITGGSRGIGLAIARALVREGAYVVVTGRDRKALRAASVELGKRALALRCDVRDAKAVRFVFREVKKRHGHIDFLLNNAGVAHELANVDKLPLAAWQATLDINLTGLFLVTQNALPLMHAGGVIVNTLSVAAEETFAGFSAYNASKAGARAFTDTLRRELRERGIRVTALIPGAIRTEIWQQFWPDAPREKMVSPETVGEAVAHILTLPPEATIERLHIGPASGAL